MILRRFCFLALGLACCSAIEFPIPLYNTGNCTVGLFVVNDKQSIDFVEAMLNEPGNTKLVRIFRKQSSHSNYSFLGSHSYGIRGICIVNLLAVTSTCHFDDTKNLVPTRHFVFTSPKAKCLATGKLPKFTLSTYVFFELDANFTAVVDTFIFNPSKLPSAQQISMSSLPRSLSSNSGKTNFHQSALYYYSTNSQINKRLRSRIRCSFERRFIRACNAYHLIRDMIRLELNFTLLSETKIQITERETAVVVDRGYEPNMKLNLIFRRTDAYSHFIYCSETMEWATADLFFWLNPIDKSTLALFITFSILLGLYSSFYNKVEYSKRKLYKAKTKAANTKLKILGSLMSFAVLSQYGCFLTSHIMSPPDAIGVQSLKELIFDWKCKVFFPNRNPDSSPYKLVVELFASDGVPYEALKPYIAEAPKSVNEVFDAVAIGKATIMAQDFFSGNFFKPGFEKKEDSFCSFVRNANKPSHENYIFRGIGRSSVYSTMNALGGAGIIEHWYAQDFHRDVDGNRKKSFEHPRAGDEVYPFKISDWKILTIFIIWGVCLGFSAAGLVTEHLYHLLLFLPFALATTVMFGRYKLFTIFV